MKIRVNTARHWCYSFHALNWFIAIRTARWHAMNNRQMNQLQSQLIYVCSPDEVSAISQLPSPLPQLPPPQPPLLPLLLHSLPFAYLVRMFGCFVCRGCSPHPCYFLHSLPLQDFTKPKPEATRQCTHSTPQHTHTHGNYTHLASCKKWKSKKFSAKIAPSLHLLLL